MCVKTIHSFSYQENIIITILKKLDLFVLYFALEKMIPKVTKLIQINLWRNFKRSIYILISQVTLKLFIFLISNIEKTFFWKKY